MVFRKIFMLSGMMVLIASCLPQKELIESPIETPFPLPLATITKGPLSTSTSMPSDKFSVVFSVGPNKDICYPEANSEIWISNYPEDPRKLLSIAGLDFYVPEFSPDGQWIAYVQSKPSYISELKDLSNSDGKEAVWLMRVDGTRNKKVSIDIPNAILGWSNGCQVVSSVEKPLVWSPDGKYVAFINTQAIDGFVYNYYVINIETSETVFLVGQERASVPVWSPDSQHIAIVNERNVINVFDVHGESPFAKRTLGLPENVAATLYWSFVSSVADSPSLKTVSGFFYEGIADISNPKYLSYWQLDLETGNWILVGKLDFETKHYTVLAGKDKVYACDKKSENSIKVLDMPSLLSEETINLEDAVSINCSSLGELWGRNILFFGSTDLTRIEILPLPNSQITTIVNSDTLNLRNFGYIYHFSLRSDR